MYCVITITESDKRRVLISIHCIQVYICVSQKTIVTTQIFFDRITSKILPSCLEFPPFSKLPFLAINYQTLQITNELPKHPHSIGLCWQGWLINEVHQFLEMVLENNPKENHWITSLAFIETFEQFPHKDSGKSCVSYYYVWFYLVLCHSMDFLLLIRYNSSVLSYPPHDQITVWNLHMRF